MKFIIFCHVLWVELNLFENKIKLTYRQHFICHWLLWKMFSGSDCEKMRNAFWLMANANSKRYNRTSSKVYSKLKIEFSKSRSERMRGNTFNVGRKHSIENNLANGERTRKIHQNRPRDEQLVINQKNFSSNYRYQKNSRTK